VLPNKDKTEKSKPPTDEEDRQVTASESEEEIEKKAIEEYQKLGPERDNSVDIIQRP
jgi:hypothetical protein